MQQEWAEIQFDLKEYRGTYILRGMDEIMEKLDDHIVKTQTMSGSPYVEPFKVAMKKWEARLQLITQVIDEWLVNTGIFFLLSACVSLS